MVRILDSRSLEQECEYGTIQVDNQTKENNIQ